MKRFLLIVLLLIFTFLAIATAKTKVKPKLKPPCKPDIAQCLPEGCGKNFDPNLNKLKNIRSDDQSATVRTLP